MLAFPAAVKDGGDTAFELAHAMNLYDYMYRAEEMEYSAPTKSEDKASDMGTKQRRSEFAHSYDRAVPDGVGQRAANFVYSVPLGKVRLNHGHWGRRGSVFIPDS